MIGGNLWLREKRDVENRKDRRIRESSNLRTEVEEEEKVKEKYKREGNCSLCSACTR